MPNAAWIAVDWGTSKVRAWALAPDGAVIAERVSQKGMGRLTPTDYEPVLLELVDAFLDPDDITEVVICGMAGARQGWVEAAYKQVPCALDGSGSVTAPTSDRRLRVRIVPGLSQAVPPDVMRGEETQLAGYLSSTAGDSGIVCLPGTHTKWVELSEGHVRQFRTVMTGEIFALLAEGSVLRHSVGEGWNDEAFAAAVKAAWAQPASVAAELFSIRAQSLLGESDAAANRSKLSGLLVGQELAATQALWAGREVTVIGAPSLGATYVSALAAVGCAARAVDGADTALAGLRDAYDRLRGQET